MARFVVEFRTKTPEEGLKHLQPMLSANVTARLSKGELIVDVASQKEKGEHSILLAVIADTGLGADIRNVDEIPVF